MLVLPHRAGAIALLEIAEACLSASLCTRGEMGDVTVSIYHYPLKIFTSFCSNLDNSPIFHQFPSLCLTRWEQILLDVQSLMK